MTKSEITKVTQYILNNSKGFVEAHHERFLINNVFINHPNFKEKVGCGINHIEVRHNIFNQNTFYIIRKDGTETDISYTKSLKYPSKKSIIMKACRNAVKDEIIELRNKIELPFICPITGESVTEKSNIHIDHYDMTFEELFCEWIKDKDIDYLYSLTLDSRKDGELETYFSDNSVIDDFRDFHDKNTHLKAVSSIANLSILRMSNIYKYLINK